MNHQMHNEVPILTLHVQTPICYTLSKPNFDKHKHKIHVYRLDQYSLLNEP